MTQMEITEKSTVPSPAPMLPAAETDPPSPSWDENAKVNQWSSELSILDGMAWKFTGPNIPLDLLNRYKQN